MASIYFSILIEALDHISFILFFKSDPGLVGRPQCYNSLGQRAAFMQFAWFFSYRTSYIAFLKQQPCN